MKKAKRWLALILAVALLGSNGIYQLSTQLSAGETESQDTSGEDVSAQNEEESQSVADVPAQDESGAEVTVQEVPDTQDQTATVETPAETQQETVAAQTVDVKLQKPAIDGGEIQIWGDDGNKSDVVFGADNLYTRTINEGENLHFQITAKDGYTVEKVTDQNGTQIQPESVSGSVYTYSVNGITSERVLSILYKEATPAAAPTENTEDVAKDDAAKDQA